MQRHVGGRKSRAQKQGGVMKYSSSNVVKCNSIDIVTPKLCMFLFHGITITDLSILPVYQIIRYIKYIGLAPGELFATFVNHCISSSVKSLKRLLKEVSKYQYCWIG